MQWWTVEPKQWLDASSLVVYASMAERVKRNGEDVGIGSAPIFLLPLSSMTPVIGRSSTRTGCLRKRRKACEISAGSRLTRQKRVIFGGKSVRCLSALAIGESRWVEIRTALIRVHDEAGNVIETHEHAGDFKRALSVIA